MRQIIPLQKFRVLFKKDLWLEKNYLLLFDLQDKVKDGCAHWNARAGSYNWLFESRALDLPHQLSGREHKGSFVLVLVHLPVLFLVVSTVLLALHSQAILLPLPDNTLGSGQLGG